MGLIVFKKGTGTIAAPNELQQNKYQFLRTLQTPLNYNFSTNNAIDVIGNDLTFNGSPTIVSGQFAEAVNFSGDGESITTAGDSDLGTNDFTIGFWINSSSISDGFNTLVSTNDYRNQVNGGWRVYKNNDSFQFWYYVSAPSGTLVLDIDNFFLLSTWQHVIFTRRNGTFLAYVDGTLAGSNTFASANLFTPNGFEISTTQSGLGANAILDDIFILKGVSLIGTNDPAVPFIVPATETRPPRDYDPRLNNIVFQLTGQHIYNYYGSLATNNLDDLVSKSLATTGTITLDNSIVKFTDNRTLLFNNTDQLISLATSTDFGFGTDDFVVELQVRFNSLTGTQDILRIGNIRIYQTANTIRFNDGTADRITSSTLSPATWYHVVLQKTNGTSRLYINGASAGTYADSNDYASTNTLLISNSTTNAFAGNIDQIRVFKAESIYPSTDFTPPQVPLYNPQKNPVSSDRSKAVFWLDADDSTTTVDKLGNALTFVGNTSRITRAWLYGSYAYDFDGTGDEITTPDKLEWEFDRVGGYTVECWFSVDTDTANRRDLIKHGTNWSFGINTSNQLSFTYNNGATQEINDASTLSTSTLYHAQFTYDGTNGILRLNGTQVATAAITGTPTDIASVLTLGTNLDGKIYSAKIVENNKYPNNYFIFLDDPLETNHYSTDLLIIADDTYGTSFNWDEIGKSLTSNNTTVTADSDFFYGQGIDFNGTDSVISVNDKPANYDDDFSIELEIKEDNQTGSKDLIEGDNYLFTLNGTTLQLESPLATTLISATVGSGIKRVFLGRKDGELRLAVDNTFTTPVADTTTLQHSTKLEIGGGNNNPFDGKLGSPRMKHTYLEPSWNRPPPIASDPNINKLVYLYPGIGVNGATLFPELKGFTLTPTGSVTTSTAQSQLNGSSTFFNVAYLSTGSSTTLSAGNGDFYISGWWWVDSSFGSNDKNGWLFVAESPTSFSNEFYIAIAHIRSGSTSGNRWQGFISRNSGGGGASVISLAAPALNAWHYCECGRKDGTLYFKIDGILQGTTTATATHHPTVVVRLGRSLTNSLVGFNQNLVGYAQWVRYYIGYGGIIESTPIPTQPPPIR